MPPAAPSRKRTATRRPPSPEPDASTRERMLDVALDAFSELGFDGASTRAIAARAGVNQGLIPYYFGTKEKLWKEAVERAFDELREALSPALQLDPEEGNEADRVALVVRQLVHFVARRPAFARMMSDEGKRDGPRMRWIVDRHARPLFEATGEALGRLSLGGPEAELDPIHGYYIVIGAATHLFHQAPECKRLAGIDATDEAVVEAHADALVHLFTRGLVGQSPTAPRSGARARSRRNR